MNKIIPPWLFFLNSATLFVKNMKEEGVCPLDAYHTAGLHYLLWMRGTFYAKT